MFLVLSHLLLKQQFDVARQMMHQRRWLRGKTRARNALTATLKSLWIEAAASAKNKSQSRNAIRPVN
jgi:hypothetical protein